MNDMTTQANRRARLTTPLGPDGLILLRMQGTEALSELFTWRVEAFSEEEEIDEAAVLGHACRVEVQSEFGTRHFHGICTDLRWTGTTNGRTHYELILRPQLWFLTLQRDSRIFHRVKVTDLIGEVLDEAGIRDYLFDLDEEPIEIVYCTQYQESNFAFISRIMEKYGLYFFHICEENTHQLIVTNSRYAHREVDGFDTIPYMPTVRPMVDVPRFHSISRVERVLTDIFELNDYNYENATGQLLSSEIAPVDHGNSGNERYYSTVGFSTRSQGLGLAAIMRDAERIRAERIHASGDTSGLHAGCRLSIENDPLPTNGDSLICVRAQHNVTSDTYRSAGRLSANELYQGAYELLPAQLQFRAPMRTPRPYLTGPHTATVVGQEGEEIDVDEHGRILAHLHWERRGTWTCRMRIAQTFAGNGYGAQFTPRIGHEVLINFVNGDPDKPIVVGAVYNSANVPPITMPEDKTQNGWRTKSSKGGGGANEIFFEDKKGSEQFNVVAQKDYNETIKNNATISVGNDHTEDVGRDASINIGYGNDAPGSLYLNVSKDRIESVSNGDYNLGVETGNRDTYVNGTDKLEVNGAVSGKFNAGRSAKVTGADKVESSGDRTEKSETKVFNEAPIVELKASSEFKAHAPTVDIDGTNATKIGSKEITISGSSKITLTCGGSKIEMTPGGIEITGTQVKLNS